MPYLGMWVFSLVASLVADHLQQRGAVTTQAVRKVATAIGKTTSPSSLFPRRLLLYNLQSNISYSFLNMRNYEFLRSVISLIMYFLAVVQVYHDKVLSYVLIGR